MRSEEALFLCIYIVVQLKINFLGLAHSMRFYHVLQLF